MVPRPWLLLLCTQAAAVSLRWHLANATTHATRWADDSRVNVRTLKGHTAAHACARVEPFVPLTSPVTLPPPKQGRRVAWFMSMSKPDDEVSATYVDFARAATASARLNAPTLYPFFLYTFLPHQDVEEADDTLVRFLKRAGTHVLKWRLSFYADIPLKIRKSKQGHVSVGAFGRLDVPLVASTVLKPIFEQNKLDKTYVLYTDTDVIFAQDWPAHNDLTLCRKCGRGWPSPGCCKHPLQDDEPAVFLAGTEVFSIWGLNSGVMYMNVPRMLADRGALLDWGNAKQWNFLMYDQGMLESFYRQRARAEELTLAKAPFRPVTESNWHAWESFDDLKFNARGFMRVPPKLPYLWHWHGFTPYDVACWLGVLEKGNWSFEEPVRDAIQRTKKKKFCRGLLGPRMVVHECSLAMYLDLYAAHRRLLAIADALAA